MKETLEFPDLLRLIGERSDAFCAAVAAAPDLDAPVPTCPGWTLFDLVEHLGSRRRGWVATIAAGPDATARAESPGPGAPRERDALLAWMAESTQQMVDALRAAGPERGCWAWWTKAQTPRTIGTVARHQLHEMAMHTYDAQLTAGVDHEVPVEIALDGVDEFLFTVTSNSSPWPHEPAAVDLHASEGRSWRVRMSPETGARAERLDPAAAPADAAMTGTAQELVLTLFGRFDSGELKVEGDAEQFERLAAWEPE